MIDKANELMKLGRWEEALSCLQPAEASFRVVLAKGICLASLNRREEALPFYDAALNLEPRSGVVWDIKAMTLSVLGRLSEARDCSLKAVELQPGLAMAWMNKAATEERLGLWEDAIKSHERFLQAASPAMTKPIEHARERIRGMPAEASWNDRGYRHNEEGRPDEAIRCFDEALRLNPRNAIAGNNKGRSLMILERVTEALACFEQALQSNPEYALAWNNQAAALHGLGRMEEAIVAYERVLKLAPDLVVVWYNKALAEHAAGKRPQTINSLSRFLELALPSHSAEIENAVSLLKELTG